MSFLVELWRFIAARRKYWLVPVFMILLLERLLVFLQATALAPLIYTFF